MERSFRSWIYMYSGQSTWKIHSEPFFRFSKIFHDGFTNSHSIGCIASCALRYFRSISLGYRDRTSKSKLRTLYLTPSFELHKSVIRCVDKGTTIVEFSKPPPVKSPVRPILTLLPRELSKLQSSWFRFEFEYQKASRSASSRLQFLSTRLVSGHFFGSAFLHIHIHRHPSIHRLIHHGSPRWQ